MASEICKGCDLYKPLFFTVYGRECAAFKTCVTNNQCGLRMPPLTPEERQKFYGSGNIQKREEES